MRFPNRRYFVENDLMDVLRSLEAENTIAYYLRHYFQAQIPEGVEIVGNHIKISGENRELIAYLPKDKYAALLEDEGAFKAKGRVRGKPVRMFKKLVPHMEHGTDAQWEQFGNMWLAATNHTPQIELVRGDDIRYWYSGQRYSRYSGSLAKSCMRSAECQKFFEIYVGNPEVCELAILKSNVGGFIDGRALVWTFTDGTRMMDRAYGSDVTIELFQKFAHDQKWSYRNPRNRMVQLTNWLYYYYPYMDTMVFLDYTTGLLAHNMNAFPRQTEKLFYMQNQVGQPIIHQR